MLDPADQPVSVDRTQFPVDSRTFFNALQTPIAILNDAFEFVDINESFEAAFGFSQEQLQGKSSLVLYDSATASEVQSNRIQIQEAPGGKYSFERRIVTRGGELQSAVIRVSSVLSRDGERLYALLFEDVHEASEREKMLFSRAEMFRISIAYSPLPISIQDRDYRLLMVNHAFCRFVGYAEHEVLGRDPADFLHPPEARDKIQFQRDIVSTSKLDSLPIISVVREIIHRDGRRIPYHLEFGPSRGIDGATLWCSTLLDVSKQKQAQLALREQVAFGDRLRNRFDTFATVTSDAVLVADRESGHVVYANDAVLDVLGVERVGAAGHSVNDLWSAVVPADRQKAEELIASPPEVGQTEIILRVQHEQNGPISVRIRLFNIDNAYGEYFILAEDVSDVVKRERQRINESLRQRDLFVREVHHRIKNNLHGLVGLLMRHADRKPQMKESLDDVATQIAAIAQIHGLQLGGGSEDLNPTRLVRSVADGLRRIFGCKLQFSAIGNAELDEWCISDTESVPLALIMNELITNACKHAQGREALSIDAEATGDRLTFRIVNQGSLPEGFDLARIQGRSQGLGLVKSLVPKRGLQVALDSNADTVVATVCIEPPVLRRS